MDEVRRLWREVLAELECHERSMRVCATTGSHHVPLEIAERAHDAWLRARRLEIMLQGVE